MVNYNTETESTMFLSLINEYLKALEEYEEELE